MQWREAFIGMGALLLLACAKPTATTTTSSAGAPRAAAVTTAKTTKRARMLNSNGTRKTFPPAAPDVAGKMHVFSYADFGPQALAGMLLGQDCYPFGECCCMEYGDAFEVRVVVYAGVEESEVAKRYPTGPETGDYRLVPAARAKAFVSTELADLEAWPAEDRIPTLEATLRETKKRLERSFP